jgi:hypothetical protein
MTVEVIEIVAWPLTNYFFKSPTLKVIIYIIGGETNARGI